MGCIQLPVTQHSQQSEYSLTRNLLAFPIEPVQHISRVWDNGPSPNQPDPWSHPTNDRLALTDIPCQIIP